MTGINETELVALPKDWEIKHLKDIILDSVGGGTPSTKVKAYWDGDINWTTSKRLSDKLYLMDGEKRISNQALESTSTKLVPSGNVIVSTRVTVGKAMVNKIDIAISQDLTGLLIDKQHYLPEFVAYHLKTEQIQSIFESQKRGATIKGITREDLGNIPLLCPPFSEQGKIVRVLWLIQSAIETQEKIIQTTTELKKALMQKLFTEGLKGEPQKETEIGLVPKSWQVVELGDVCIQRKEAFTPTTNGKGRYVGLEHIQTGEFRLPSYGNESEVRSAKYKFYEEDILYGKLRPYLDKAVLVDISGICSTDIIVLRGNERLLQTYSIGLVHTNKFVEYAKRTTSGVNHPRTSWNSLKKFRFGLPTIKEQKEIGLVLHQLTNKIENNQSRKKVLQSLFKSMLHHLMTGQVRVKDLRLS